MRTKTFFGFLILILFVSCTSNETKKKPPLAKEEPVKDTYFGQTFSDPYRNLENLNDSSVLKWFRIQSDYARNVLNDIPGRQSLIDKMIEFDGRRATRVTMLNITENDKYFYLKTTPADETGKLYYRDGFGGTETFLFDPQRYASDTTEKYVIGSISPNLDGSKVAFVVAPNGSESSIILTMDVKTKILDEEKIDRTWIPSISWLPDGKSFFYNRLKSGDVHQKDRELDSKTYWHFEGTDPVIDKEIFSRAKLPELGIRPEDIPIAYYDNDSKYLFGVLATVDNRLNLYFAPFSDMKKGDIKWKHLFKPEDEVYSYATTDKDLYIYTPKGAPNYKIIKTSLTHPDLEKAEVVVPEDPKRTITTFALFSDGLCYATSENGVSVKLFFLPDGSKTAKEIQLPFPAGDISITSKGYKYNELWVSITGWTSDLRRFRYLPSKNEFIPENLSSLPSFPEFADLTVEELMIPTWDGKLVPLSLIYNKNIKKDGNNPVFIYGYGAYGISMSPRFDPDRLLLANYNAILAVAHVRGGGELGDKWYKDGYKTTKPNTWKDLIACAEFMISNNYTSSKKIAINSASAGGILIGRAMTERPDLFAAAIPEVGCLDPVRAEESPNGPVNVPEFGTVKDSIDCKALIEMDSYLHIKDGTKYPATLITAGMNDPRVIVWQPAKFAARLEAANASDKPILFLVDYHAGHGIGNSKKKDFERLADVFSFALWQTGVPGFQLK